MQITWMKTFLAVAEELHFGRAAQRLNLAQPAVSQQIQNMEKSLHTRLFERDKRSVKLTDAGAAFLDPCRAALTAIDIAAGRARNAGTGEHGRLRIGYNAGFGPDLFINVIRAVSERYPHLQLEVDSSRTNTENLRNLEAGKCDLALVGGTVTGTGLSWQVLGSMALGLVLPMIHPLAEQESISMGQLREEAFILFKPAPGRTLRSMAEELFELAGFLPRKIVEVKDGMSVHTLVAAGLGMGFGPYPSGSTVPSTLAMRPLTESTPVDLSIVWRAGTETPALTNVLDLVRSRFALV